MSDEFLRHVCQRIDALTYDEHSHYLLGSLRAADVPMTPAVSSGSSMTSTTGAGAMQTPGTPMFSATTTYNGGRRPSFGVATTGGASAMAVSSRRRRAHPWWAKIVGLTSYYVRFVLLIGVGWFFAMMGIFTFLYSFTALSENDLRLTLDEQVMTLSMYFASGAVGCILFGSLADHYGRRRVLLAAVGEWIVTNALTGVAWGPISLLVLRALSSLGIGGQFVLLVTISLEYTPKRTRGRITVVSLALATVGILAGVWYGHTCVPLVTWRASFSVVSGVALAYLAVLYGFLEESPKYLASTGRSAEALRVLAVMETAHGIDRQARVTVPSSLYAPRPQQQQQQQQQSESISEQPPVSGERRRALTELYRQPHHVDFEDAPDADGRIKRQLQDESDDRELRGVLGIGSRPRHHATVSSNNAGPAAAADQPASIPGMSPGVVSFAQSLRLRLFGVLLRAPLLRRTLLLWLLWFSMGLSLATALTSMLVLAQLTNVGSFADQLVWSGATIPGILLSAVLVERAGRKLTLALFLFANGVAMAAVAALLTHSTAWASYVWSTAFLALSATGTLGSICAFTGEQYPLMVRSLGMGLSAGAGHLGMFAGVYAILRLTLDVGWGWTELRIAIAAASGLALLVALPLAAVTGVETRGHDVDTLEWHALNARKRPHLRHQRDFEDPAASGDGSSDGRAVERATVAAARSSRPETRTSSLENSAMLGAPTSGVRTTRATSTPAPVPVPSQRSTSAAGTSAHRSSLPVLMASSSSSASSGVGGGLDSPLSPPSVSLSPSRSPSSMSSSSSSSSLGFWKKRSVHRLRRQVKAVADAVRARKTLSASSASAAKKARTFTGSSRSTTLPSDDLDLLDTIVTDHELDADGGYAFASVSAAAAGRRRAKSGGQRRRTRTASGGLASNSRWFVPSLSSESVMSIGRWRQSSSAASSSSASSSSSVEPLEPPVPRAKRKSSRARARTQSRRTPDAEPVLEILEPAAFTGSGRFPATDEEDKLGGGKSSGDESRLSIDLDMFDTFTSMSTPVPAGGAR